MNVLLLVAALILDRGMVPRGGGGRAIRWSSDSECHAGRTYRIRLHERKTVTVEVGSWRWTGMGPALIRVPIPDRPWTDITIRLVSGRRSSTLWTVIVP